MVKKGIDFVWVFFLIGFLWLWWMGFFYVICGILFWESIFLLRDLIWVFFDGMFGLWLVVRVMVWSFFFLFNCLSVVCELFIWVMYSVLFLRIIMVVVVLDVFGSLCFVWG